MKTCQISGVELDKLKILSDVLNGKLTLREASYALHLSYRQALDAKKVEKAGITHPSRRSFRLSLLFLLDF